MAAKRIDLHRRIGFFGAGLAAVMIPLGMIGALIAAGRPTGFIDVPLPPLQFLVVPFANLAVFGAFVTLGILNRHNAQSHKRYMLLASISILGAAFARWPFAIMAAEFPVPRFSMLDAFVDSCLIPMALWDFASRGRLHPVTLWGGLALIASQPLSSVLSETKPWLAFAGWAVGLFGH